MNAQPKGWAFVFRHHIRQGEIICLSPETLCFFVYWLVTISTGSSHFAESTDLLPLQKENLEMVTR